MSCYKLLFYYTLLVRIKGLKVSGNEISPIIHLRMETNGEAREEDEKCLENIVSIVSFREMRFVILYYAL